MQFCKIELIAKLGEKETRKFEYNLCVTYLETISKSINLLIEKWEYENLEWDYINIIVSQVVKDRNIPFFAGQVSINYPGLIRLL